MLRLPDHWVWDNWIAVDGDRYHLFFLRASRALHDPDRRHLRAAIGHAVSEDLRHWELLPDALVHADGPAWDDQAVWTGSVVRGPDGWYLFYSGVSRAGAPGEQRIGVAASADLVTWHRVGAGPLLLPDPRWYDGRDTWRDPFVFADPAGDGWHMLMTARARTGPAGGRGVLGHARGHDLLHWEVRPPLSGPAGFHHLEVPQVYRVGGQAVLIFSCRPAETTTPARTAGITAGTWTVAGGSMTGYWDVASAVPIRHASLYCARLVHDPRGDWWLLGFRDVEDGVFHGEIVDPIPVSYADGRLVVDRNRPGGP